MKKTDIEFMAQFKPGQTVEIIGANFHTDTIGKKAEIVKVIKTRMELEVYIDGGFITYSEQLKQDGNPDYKPTKSFWYYPSAKNVKIINERN